MKTLLLTSTFLLSVAGAASAADPVAYVPEIVVSGFSWTGGYVGGEIGYVVGGSADYLYESGTGGDADYNYIHDLDGLFGGVYGGYNYQFANGFVLGGEADIVWGDINGSAIAPGDDDYSATTEVDWAGAARVRLGYAMDRFLPYVSGGLAFAHFTFTEYNNGSFYSSGDDNLLGWTLGVGTDYAITDNLVLRGEYRYTQYNDKDFLSVDENEDYNVDLDTHDLRVGIAYKF